MGEENKKKIEELKERKKEIRGKMEMIEKNNERKTNSGRGSRVAR